MATEGNLGALFARIAKIAGEIGTITKNAKHEQGYAYHSADSIMGHINKLMSEHGLAIVPTVVDTTIMEGKDEVQRWLITYEYIIGDADGNVMTAKWTGEAPIYGKRKDGSLFTDDKSMGKAHTYALKYYLMKLFMISTVSDDLDTNVVDKGAASKQANSGKKSTNIDDHLPKGKTSSPTWEEAVNTLIRPLYESAIHHGRALNAAITNKIVNVDMKVNEAAAALLVHRASADFGFDYEQVCEVLGKAPEDLLQQPESFYKAWQLLIKANEAMPM